MQAHQAGRLLVGAGNRAVVSRAEEDVVIDRWSTDCRMAVVRIDQEYLENQVRAVEAIHERPEEPFTVLALAQLAGVSVRTLQAGFRRYLDCTPLAYLRAVRLARAHEDLRAADPGVTTVSQVAYRWGFVHLGRFAADYRTRYHTTPARTLKSGTADGPRPSP